MSTRFLVVCQARTGSTMLLTALQEHAEVCAHGEVLNLRDDDQLEFLGLNYQRPTAIHDYLRRERFRNPANFIDRYAFFAGRCKTAGFKFKYEELSHPAFQSAREYVLRNRDIRIVHMHRENLWKRYLSEYIALNVTKVFNSSEQAIVVPDTSFRLEPEKVLRALERSEAWQREYRTALSAHPNMTVTYEEFAVDPAAAFQSVTDFLGVSHHGFTPRTKKIKARRSPSETIENYTELLAFFRTTRFAHMFDDDGEARPRSGGE